MPTGNAWAGNERKERDKATNNVQGTSKARSTQGAMEVLSKGAAYHFAPEGGGAHNPLGDASIAADDAKALRYRPSGRAPGAKPSATLWASKPNNMANGKDFFTELRKQVSTLQQAGERAGG